MRLSDPAVLYVAIFWLATIAAYIAFNLWRTYRNDRIATEKQRAAMAATGSCGPALDEWQSLDPIIPEVGRGLVSRGREGQVTNKTQGGLA